VRIWTDEERLAVVHAYVTEGSFDGAEKLSGVPAATIRQWSIDEPEWWQSAYERVLRELDTKNIAALLRLQEKATRALEDRLKNGDFLLNESTG
jgi:hypothetical protein